MDTVGSTLLSIICLPLEMACITLSYFDLRVRSEGLDLAIMAVTDGAETFDSELFAMQAPAPYSGFEFTGRELGYFCLIAMGAALIIGAIALVFGGLMTAVLGNF